MAVASAADARRYTKKSSGWLASQPWPATGGAGILRWQTIVSFHQPCRPTIGVRSLNRVLRLAMRMPLGKRFHDERHEYDVARVARRSPTLRRRKTSQPTCQLGRDATRGHTLAHVGTFIVHRIHRLPTTSCHNLHRIASHCTSFVIRVTSHDVHPRWRVRSGLQSHCQLGRNATRWHTVADVRSAIMADGCPLVDA